jgi:hypothetical protein
MRGKNEFTESGREVRPVPLPLLPRARAALSAGMHALLADGGAADIVADGV